MTVTQFVLAEFGTTLQCNPTYCKCYTHDDERRGLRRTHYPAAERIPSCEQVHRL
jgi:hypothetical protein